MINQLDLFNNYKAYNVAYPTEKFSIGSTPSHWFDENLRQVFSDLLAKLPQFGIYLELGSFLGAGSTRCALTAHSSLRAYCIDSFNMTGVQAAKFKPRDARIDGTICDYYKGRGNQLQHFMNNTWDFRDRIACLQRNIGPQLLQQLFETGVRPNLILIDDDHQHKPLLSRLRSISKFWPEAMVVCDDHVPMWNGVRTACQAAFSESLYSKSDSTLLAGRLMVLNKDALQNVDKTTT